MSPDKQREIARKGGASVPAEKRSFAQSRALAAAAGAKGGSQPRLAGKAGGRSQTVQEPAAQDKAPPYRPG